MKSVQIFLLALFYFELIAIAHGGRGLPCFKSGQETVMEETDEEDDHNVEGVSQADRCVIDQLLDDIYQWRKMEGKEKWDVIKLIQYKHGEPLKSLNPRISNILKVCYDYGYTHDPVHDSTRAPKERNSNRLTACETWFKPEWISIHVSPEILTDIVGHFLDDIYKWKKVEKNSKSAMINLIVTSYGEFLKDLNSRVPWTGIIIQPCWHYGYTALEGQKGVPVEVNSNRLYACKVLFKPELLSENRELMTRLQE